MIGDDRSPLALPGADGAWLPGGLADRILAPLARHHAPDVLAQVLGAPLAVLLLSRMGPPAGALLERAVAATVIARATRSRAQGVIDALAGQGIASVPIKGFATGAVLYPHPAYRALPDVDLLVAEKDVKRAAAWLKDQGFRSATEHLDVRRWGALTRASFAPLAAPDGALLLDVHQAIDDPPAALGLPAADVIAAADPLPLPGHMFIILALHAFRDFYEPRIVKGLIDAALLLDRYDDTIDWPDVEARARRGRFMGRLILYRELLRACGIPAPSVLPRHAASAARRRFARAAAANIAQPAWHGLTDLRKVAVEVMALDRLGDVGRNYARRLHGLVRPASHNLPGF